MDIKNLDRDGWRDLYDVVFNTARKIVKGKEAARALASDAITRMLATGRPLPDEPVAFEREIYGILKSVRSHEAASRASRRNYERTGGREQAALSPAGRSAQAIVLDHAERQNAEALARERHVTLRARLEGHELDLTILDWMLEGVTKTADLEKQTGRPYAEVKTAMARIRRHMNAILAAERGEDEEVES